VQPFAFQVIGRDGRSAARAGLLTTPHGPVPTPAFLPVATQGAVKAATPADLEALGATALMTNAYHLAMRPGARTVAELGGVHALAGWPRPIMTDSGGFQVFSLAHRRRLSADAVTFQSHVDGSSHSFSPESVMELHALLGGDMILPLDVCSAYPADRDTAARDAETTVRWARRSLAAHQRQDQLLYGIVQGSTYADLRGACARAIVDLGFRAYAVGGVSVGEPKADMLAALDATVPLLPEDAPRHLLGVGELDDVVEGIARGLDTFDCVVPTRWARHGTAMTRGGRLNMRNAVHAGDRRPIEADCTCPACARFGRGSIRHFLLAGEILGLQLLTAHNLHVVVGLAAAARRAILDGTFHLFRHRWTRPTAGLDEAERTGVNDHAAASRT